MRVNFPCQENTKIKARYFWSIMSEKHEKTQRLLIREPLRNIYTSNTSCSSVFFSASDPIL
jgi:hypothetical protein